MRNVRFLSFKEFGKSYTASLWLIDYSLNAATLPIALRLFSLSSQTASHVVYEACLHTSWGEKACFYSPLPEAFDPKNSKLSRGRIKLMKQHYIGTQEGTVNVLSVSPQQPQATVAINILSLQTMHCAHTSTVKATARQTKLTTCSERPATSTRHGKSGGQTDSWAWIWVLRSSGYKTALAQMHVEKIPKSLLIDMLCHGNEFLWP